MIDPASLTIFLVTTTETTTTPVVFHHRLHALSVTTGNEQANSPVDIVATYPGTGVSKTVTEMSSSSLRFRRNSPGLLLFNGTIYSAYGSYEDNGCYQGWVIAYDKTSLKQVGVFNTSPNSRCSTNGELDWQAGLGLVADADSGLLHDGECTF